MQSSNENIVVIDENFCNLNIWQMHEAVRFIIQELSIIWYVEIVKIVYGFVKVILMKLCYDYFIRKFWMYFWKLEFWILSINRSSREKGN